MTAINFNSIYTTYYRRAFLFTLSYVHNDLVAEDYCIGSNHLFVGIK